jgi:hypothetical protein
MRRSRSIAAPGARRVMRAVHGVAIGLAAACAAAAAQDFTPAAPEPLAPAALVAIDRGLAADSAGTSVATAATRWFGLESLRFAAAAVAGGWGPWRGALGVAGCGDAAVGWNALGVSCGWAGAGAGVAVRAVARRDRIARGDDGGSSIAGATLDPAAAIDESGGDPGPPRDGGETGAGAWVRFGGAVHAWVAHPQLASYGQSPPLARGLEAGVSWRRPDVWVWAAREAAPRGVGSETHRAGLAIPVARGALWMEARDAPLRVAAGCRIAAGVLAVSAAVETHPVLGETVRFGLAAGR